MRPCLDERFEICISDNASEDGTAAMIKAMRGLVPCAIVYERQPENRGLGRNLLRLVELARGDYCWFIGSDDLVAPCGLRRGLEAMDNLPGASGYLVGYLYVDPGDASLRTRQLSSSFLPAGGEPRMIEGFDAICDECGNSTTGLSWFIVRRVDWLRAADKHGERSVANPSEPHSIVLAEMWRASPRVGWLPGEYIHMRDAETYIWSEDDQPLADRWRLVTDGHASGWAEVLGRRSESWRRRMVRLSAVWGTAQNARATKLHQRPSVGSQLLFAVSWARAFGHIRSYRRQVLPATLAPIWLTRLRFAHDSQWAQKAPILEAARDRLVLRGHLPQTLGATGIGRASVVVRSQGGRRIRSDGPCAVAVGQHWETADGGRIGWDELRVNHLGRYPIPLPHDLKRGDEVSVDVPLYAPVEPGAYRLTVVAEQTGRRLDSVGVSTALTAEVVVR